MTIRWQEPYCFIDITKAIANTSWMFFSLFLCRLFSSDTTPDKNRAEKSKLDKVPLEKEPGVVIGVKYTQQYWFMWQFELNVFFFFFPVLWVIYFIYFGLYLEGWGLLYVHSDIHSSFIISWNVVKCFIIQIRNTPEFVHAVERGGRVHFARLQICSKHLLK